MKRTRIKEGRDKKRGKQEVKVGNRKIEDYRKK
jgi:hypothetical protein